MTHSKILADSRNRGKLSAEVEDPKIQRKKSTTNKKKANLFNQINSSDGESFVLSRCPRQQKKKKSLPICKGKNDAAEEMHVDTMDIDPEGIQFPDEMITDILTRLPVRSLQRFKCVSPCWNTLISDHYFIMNHLNRAKNDPNSQKILATSLPPINDKLEFYRLSLSSSSVQVIEDEQRLDWPPNCKPHCVLRCCCDGLILLTTSDIKIKLTYLLLWNPSTRESIPLPAREYELGDWHLHNWVFGMGYDATSDDYKILAAKLNAPSNEKVSVEILSLKSFSWRKISKYPAGMGPVSGFLHCGMDSLTFIHGAFHWLARSSKRYTIISFNISNEVYGEILLLEGMYDMKVFRLNHGVSMLRGMLCYYNAPIGFAVPWPCTYKFWVMKDYGIKESWIQWFEIPYIDGLGSAIPCYVFADDDVLLELIMFRGIEPLYWTSKRGTFQLWPKLFQTIVYTESLISPKLLI